MPINITEIESAMLTLNKSDLAALLLRGIQMLDEGDADVSQKEIDASWRDEISARISDIQSKKVDTVPAEEMFSRIHAKLAARNT